MSTAVSKLKEKLYSSKEPLKNFFEGSLYPALVAVFTLVGHISGLEFYINIVNMLAVCVALLVCTSFKPILPFMLTVIFQVNIKHSPGIPTWSSYYFETPKLIILAILVALLVGSLVYFIIKNTVPKIRRDAFRKLPLFPSVIILAAAFLLNGLFSSEWRPSSLIYGFIQAFIYSVFFYIIYYGFEDEDVSALLDSLSYIAALVAAVLIGEMIFMFLTYDSIFANGSLVKEEINLGWGIWNPIGFCLTVTIPMQMRGAMKLKYPFVYLTSALLTWIFAILTLSRNALIFASLAIAASMIIACFVGERKRLFRIITAVGVLLAVAAVALLWDKISTTLIDLINRGFSDNGRYELWSIGINNFLSAPVFGTGFFGYGETDVFMVATFIPTLAHNTLVEMLSAAGIVGILAYLYYRASTAILFIKNFSYEKLMLLLPILLTLGMSLIDNFVFHFYTSFWYLICLAVVCKMNKEQQKEMDSE